MSDAGARDGFAREGFGVVRGALAAAEVAALARRIDASMAADAALGALRRYTHSSFCPDLVADPGILSVFEACGARAAAEGLFGGAGRVAPVQRAQVALRFPEDLESPPQFGFHLDGFPAPHNQVPEAQVFRPTLVAGLFLTEAAGPGRGGLAVWPGSHVAVAQWARGQDLEARVARDGPAGLLAAIEDLDLGEPVELAVQPGDLVLLHHLLAHAGAPNLSVHVRKAIYFRAQHVDHLPTDLAPLTDERRFFAGVSWPARG